MLKLCTIAAAALLLPLGMTAQDMRGPHPGYGRALENLRYARALLERGDRGWGPVAADQQRATSEIDRAIEELRHAAEADGRNPNAHPPVDANWEPHDRLRRASEALSQARDEISRGEANPGARELRDRAYRHIDDAQRALHHAMENWHDRR